MDHDHVTPPTPPRLGWRRVAQTVALVAFAFSLNGWKANECSKKYTYNPLNNQTKTRLEIDVQPPEKRPFVHRLTVETNTASSPANWTQAGSVTGLSSHPTAFDVAGEEGMQYRIQAWDTCDRLLAQTATATGITRVGDTKEGPDRLTIVLRLPEGEIAPCEPSPSPSPSQSAMVPSPPASTPPTSTAPSQDPSLSQPHQSGAGSGGGGTSSPNASVTVTLNGQVQRGGHAASEGWLQSAFPSASPTPTPSTSPSPSPSPSPSASAF